jgi:hypothetical protein
MRAGSPDWRRGKFRPSPFDKLPRQAPRHAGAGRAGSAGLGRLVSLTFSSAREYKPKGHLGSVMRVGSGIEMGGPGNMTPA